MDSTYTMRITCDPYTKEIIYECYEDGKYININEYSAEYCSELINEKFTKTSFQSRAYEIIELINQHFNPGNVGLKIVFIGNNEDYEALRNVAETYFSGCSITCIKDPLYYNEPTYVIKQIEKRFDDVITTLEDGEYTKEAIAAEIGKYKDTIDESIAVCVTGLCSSGKSAFINSLIGYEILPSSSDPTTAKMFRISCSETYSIALEAYERTISVTFTGNEYEISPNCPTAISSRINMVMRNCLAGNEIMNIHNFLKEVNKGKVLFEVEKVDINIPFVQATFFDPHYQFVIYDTPGSNSDSNRKHFDVLKESLSKQTNALLILLTTPDTMDFTDNNDLLDLIQETGESLDTSNAIIVVNKSDTLSPSSLAEKREHYQDLKVSRWKSTRIFFLSSIIAMASKKSDPDDSSAWIDADAYETYDEKSRKFQRGDRVLYQYNIVDKSKEVAPVVEEGTVSDPTLFINSGLASIEHEIADYALRYALCNKCSRATEYLHRAIQLCEDNVREIEQKRDNELISTQTMFNDKQRQMAEDLDNIQGLTASRKSIEFRSELEKRFQSFMAEKRLVFRNFIQIYKLSIFEEFEEEWKRISQLKAEQGFGSEEMLDRMESKVKYRYNALLNAFSGAANEMINSFWESTTQEFKSSCKTIITDSDVLNDEQKAIMDSILLNMENMTRAVLEIDIRSIRAVKKTFFGRDKFDNSNCCRNLVQNLNDVIGKEIERVGRSNSRYFEEWSKALIANIKTQLCTFNADLHDWEVKIGELSVIIEEKKKHLRLLEETRAYVRGLLEIQGKEAEE